MDQDCETTSSGSLEIRQKEVEENGIEEEPDPVDLASLPPEILLLVFSHVRPKHLMRSVRLVCRKFYHILNGDRWWNLRIRSPPFNVTLSLAEQESDSYAPSRTFDAMTIEGRRWRNWPSEKVRVTKEGVGHFGTIDAVKLFERDGKRYCLTGARDRMIKLWSIDQVESTEDSANWLVADKAAHMGWIWSFAMVGTDQFISGSWDGNLKLWNLGDDVLEELEVRNPFSIATTSISCEDGIAACSFHNQNILLFDVRNGFQEIARQRFHRSLVHSVAQKGNILYSLGEDNRLYSADIRNLTTPLAMHKFDHNVTNMCLADGLIHCVAYKKGKVNVVQASDLKPCYSFSVVGECPNFMEKRVRQVIKTTGSVLALTFSGLNAFSLGSHPSQLGSTGKFAVEPTRFDVLNGDIVLGIGDGSAIIWPRPDGYYA